MKKSYPMLEKYLIADLPPAKELLPWLRRLDHERRYTNFGPLATLFEKKLFKLLSARDAAKAGDPIRLTTMSTGYHALEVALRLFKIGPGKKVLIPAVTFPACPLAAEFTGAEPVLSDIDAATGRLTPAIARRIAEKTRIDAVMPVALYGVPLPAEEWDEFMQDTGIPVIIDAAAAIETQIIPKRGLIAHSLHATKPFGIGEGGLLVGRDARLINEARVYSNFGTYDRIARVQGSNTKMSEYHAAVGLAQLKRWAGIKKKRRQLFALYKKHLKPLAKYFTFHPGIEQAVVSSLMLRFEKPVAAAIIAYGAKRNIAFHKMYLPPLYRHPHFANLAVAGCDGTLLPAGATAERKAGLAANSEAMFAHTVGIPFHPFMSKRDMARVVEVLRELNEIH